MAGGKETPRQKMIGMMYLVLTALLALNVSKEIIEAFVAIDNNVQEANEAVRKKGTYSFESLKEVAQDKSDANRAATAKQWFEIAENIRQLTDENIKFIDELKIELLTAVGEDLSTIIINDKSVPKVIDLAEVKSKDKYDDPMRILIGSETDLRKPTGKGMDVWNRRVEFRNKLTEYLANYKSSDGTKTYSFNSKSPNEFSKCSPEDTTIVRQLFEQLTKQEFRKLHDMDNVHWVGATFDHAPVVAAIAQLSSVQTELLNAEAEALAHIRAKVGGGEYSFNKIMALAYGDSYINPGDSLNMQVLMAAFDSHKTPKVSYIHPETGETIELNDSQYNDGKGIFSYLPRRSGKDTLKGTISIQNKNGQWKTESWMMPYTVGAPTGAISQPNMQVLYRDYDNILTGAASGYPDYRLVARSNVTLTKTSEGYKAHPGSGRTAEIAIMGVAEDGTMTQIGNYTYSVRKPPKPTLYLGAIESGANAPKSVITAQTRLFLKYDESIPLTATFTPLRYEVSVSPLPRPTNGSSNVINNDSKNLIRQVQSGGQVIITCYFREPSGREAKIIGVFGVQ